MPLLNVVNLLAEVDGVRKSQKAEATSRSSISQHAQLRRLVPFCFFQVVPLILNREAA